MDIGEEERTIRVEPVENPVPERQPVPERKTVPQHAPDRAPVEPVKTPEKV